MSSKDIKYVINSILSALDLNSLEPEDKEQIMSKFEGEEEMGSEDVGMEDEQPAPEEVSAEAPPQPEGEMAELFDDNEEDIDHSMRGARKRRRNYSDDFDEYESEKMGEMFEGIFSESKVDDILKGYFKYDKKEKQLIEEQKKNKKDISKKIRTLSENVVQEVTALKLIEKNPNLKLLGKTLSNVIVLEHKDKKIKVTPNGKVL
jgi:hypothetical protein